MSQKPHRCRTWAPRGETPLLEFNFNWQKLSVSAGLTLRNFYFRLYPGAIGRLEVIDFLKALVRHIDGSLLIVWDRLPAHRSRMVREFIELSEGAYRNGVFAALCARVEPGGIHLGLLEAARVTQCLPEGLLGTRPARSQGLAPYAPQTAFDHRLLETVFSLSRLTEYYARLNKTGTCLPEWVGIRSTRCQPRHDC